MTLVAYGLIIEPCWSIINPLPEGRQAGSHHSRHGYPARCAVSQAPAHTLATYSNCRCQQY